MDADARKSLELAGIDLADIGRTLTGPARSGSAVRVRRPRRPGAADPRGSRPSAFFRHPDRSVALPCRLQGRDHGVGALAMVTPQGPAIA